MTKNISTPRKPPGSHALLAWYTMTATTASARNPSSPGRYGTRLICARSLGATVGARGGATVAIGGQVSPTAPAERCHIFVKTPVESPCRALIRRALLRKSLITWA